MEALVVLAIIAYICFAPANKDSTSYKLGRGLGGKTRKLGDWIMKE